MIIFYSENAPETYDPNLLAFPLIGLAQRENIVCKLRYDELEISDALLKSRG